MQTPPEIKVANVEAGFARVLSGRRSIGTVASEKHGSTRTGIRWIARSSWRGIIGYGATRDEAVKIVAAEYAAYIAR